MGEGRVLHQQCCPRLPVLEAVRTEVLTGHARSSRGGERQYSDGGVGKRQGPAAATVVSSGMTTAARAGTPWAHQWLRGQGLSEAVIQKLLDLGLDDEETMLEVDAEILQSAGVKLLRARVIATAITERRAAGGVAFSIDRKRTNDAFSEESHVAEFRSDAKGSVHAQELDGRQREFKPDAKHYSGVRAFPYGGGAAAPRIIGGVDQELWHSSFIGSTHGTPTTVRRFEDVTACRRAEGWQRWRHQGR